MAWLHILLIVPALLAWLAHAQVRRIYNRYRAQPNTGQASGLTIARSLLAAQGLGGVAVERTPGTLTDHYDPEKKILRLSDGVADSASVTSLGIVAHEVGHAVQDAEGYRAGRVRLTLARRLGWMTAAGPFVFAGGFLLGVPALMAMAVVMLAGQAVFALVTLPVERNASDRAIALLDQTGMAAPAEREGVRRVLRAAALTYLTGLGQKVATFLFVAVAVVTARAL